MELIDERLCDCVTQPFGGVISGNKNFHVSLKLSLIWSDMVKYHVVILCWTYMLQVKALFDSLSVGYGALELDVVGQFCIFLHCPHK